MSRLKRNPTFPEHINRSREHPLKEFAWLLAGAVLSLVVLAVCISVLVAWLSPLIPFRWEESLASSKSAQQLELSPSQPRSEAEQQRWQVAEAALTALGTSLAESQRQLRLTEDDSIGYHFHLLQSDIPNAFATLGGNIFVTSALVEEVSSENALAMVVAHEMAHVFYRHPIQALSRGAVMQLVLVALTGGSGSSAVHTVLGQAGWLTLLSFNREMERESDEAAIALLQSHYGHLAGADEFFRDMLAQQGDDGWQVWLETHPGLNSRIRMLEERVSGAGEAELTPLDAGLRALQRNSPELPTPAVEAFQRQP